MRTNPKTEDRRSKEIRTPEPERVGRQFFASFCLHLFASAFMAFYFGSRLSEFGVRTSP